jgi:hypothetical protein
VAQPRQRHVERGGGPRSSGRILIVAKIEMRVIPEPLEGTRFVLGAEHE